MNKWKLTIRDKKDDKIVDSYELIFDDKLSPKEIAKSMLIREEQYYRDEYDGYKFDWDESESHEFKARLEKVGTLEMYDFNFEINVWVTVESESVIDDFTFISDEEIAKVKEQIFLNNPDQVHLEELIGA